MSAERVEAVVEEIRRREPILGRWAEIAADGLTAGEGEEMLTQAAIRDFLWYRLPARYPDETWLPIARAAAVLLERLGLDRYASIARSETTATLLESWREGDARGLSCYHAAAEASGVKPQDTGLLGWGTVMGMDEVSAYALVEAQLEDAIVAGELVPGASGWKSHAASLTEQVLRRPAPQGGGRNWHHLILEERRKSWVETAYPEDLRPWRAELLELLIDPPDPPGDLEAVLGPMRWLLQACRDGVELTQSGYLPPSIVRDGVERFGWWDWPGQPRSEADVHQLGALRETAARLRLVAKRGRRLATSRHGIALIADHSALWHAIATTIGATDEYVALLSELIPSPAPGPGGRQRPGGVDRAHRHRPGVAERGPSRRRAAHRHVHPPAPLPLATLWAARGGPTTVGARPPDRAERHIPNGSWPGDGARVPSGTGDGGAHDPTCLTRSGAGRDLAPPGGERLGTHRSPWSYVLFDGYALQRRRLPLSTTLGKLDGRGGVAQW